MINSIMDENQKSDDNMKNELPDDTAGLKMSGHIRVRYMKR